MYLSENVSILIHLLSANFMSHDLKRLPHDLADNISSLSCFFAHKNAQKKEDLKGLGRSY